MQNRLGQIIAACALATAIAVGGLEFMSARSGAEQLAGSDIATFQQVEVPLPAGASPPATPSAGIQVDSSVETMRVMRVQL